MAFKMKGHSLPGPNQRRSPATQKKTYKDLTDKELTDAIKRNMTKDIFSVPELVIAQDSVTSGVDEHRRRFEASIKEKKKPTPAKQTEHEVVHGKQNKEVVSKTSPGPGWTKTKGTNIWAPPKGKMMGKMTRTLKPIKSTTSNQSMVSRQQRKKIGESTSKESTEEMGTTIAQNLLDKKALTSGAIAAATERLGKKKKSPAPSKSPAKIAPLVLIGAQMLGKKMMEKKQEE